MGIFRECRSFEDVWPERRMGRCALTGITTGAHCSCKEFERKGKTMPKDVNQIFGRNINKRVWAELSPFAKAVYPVVLQLIGEEEDVDLRLEELQELSGLKTAGLKKGLAELARRDLVRRVQREVLSLGDGSQAEPVEAKETSTLPAGSRKRNTCPNCGESTGNLGMHLRKGGK